MDFRLVHKKFPFVSAFIDQKTGYDTSAAMAGRHTSYNKIVRNVTRDSR